MILPSFLHFFSPIVYKTFQTFLNFSHCLKTPSILHLLRIIIFFLKTKLIMFSETFQILEQVACSVVRRCFDFTVDLVHNNVSVCNQL